MYVYLPCAWQPANKAFLNLNQINPARVPRVFNWFICTNRDKRCNIGGNFFQRYPKEETEKGAKNEVCS